MAASVRGNSVCILHISSGRLAFLLINFWESHQWFSRNIWTPLHSKFETFTHALIVITSYHVLIKNFTKWYEAETYTGDTLWWLNLVYDFIQLGHMIPLSILLWNVHTVLLPYPLRPNFNSVARMEDKVSSKKLQNRKTFQKRHMTKFRISFEAVYQGVSSM